MERKQTVAPIQNFFKNYYNIILHVSIIIKKNERKRKEWKDA